MRHSGRHNVRCVNPDSSSITIPQVRIGLVLLCRIFVFLFALIISNSAVWADSKTQPEAPTAAKDATKADVPMTFTPETQVKLFNPGTNEWDSAAFKQAKSEDEIIFGNRFYRVVSSGKVLLVSNISTSKLFKADQSCDQITCVQPAFDDVVQVLDKDKRCVAHKMLCSVQFGTTIRFQGRTYDVGLKDKETAPSPVKDKETTPPPTVHPIEITPSAMQHIIDRHTVGGKMNAGKSIFNGGEDDIKALIKYAESITPVQQTRSDNFQRVVKASRIIGFDRSTRKQTNIYTVITTPPGKLVTAFPGLP